jgi:hypothetical protein
MFSWLSFFKVKILCKCHEEHGGALKEELEYRIAMRICRENP